MPSDNFRIIEDIITINPEIVSKPNKNGDNALFISIKSGNSNISRVLIESKLIDLNEEVFVKGKIFESYLHFALREQQEAIAKLIYITAKHLSSHKNTEGKYIEHFVFNSLNIDFFDFLVSKGYNFANILAEDSTGITPVDLLLSNHQSSSQTVQYIFDVLIEHLDYDKKLCVKKFLLDKELPLTLLPIVNSFK